MVVELLAEYGPVMVARKGGRGRIGGLGQGIGGGYYLVPSFAVSSKSPDGDNAMEVPLIDGDGETILSRVIWRDKQNGEGPALLRADVNLPLPNDPVEWGRIRGIGLHKCKILGFPHPVMGENSPYIDTVYGTISLPTENYAGGLIFKVSDPDIPSSDASVPSWTQSGGSPVFSQGLFLGYLVGRQTPRRLSIFPASRIAESREFVRALASTGHPGILIQDVGVVEDFEGTGAAIDEVARTDPKNIQEVAAAQFSLSNAYYENVLLQAKRSFGAAVIAASLGTFFFFAAVAIVVAQAQFQAAVVSVISGSVVQVIAGLNFWLYSRTSSQLNAFHARLERMQKYLLANSVCANLSDEARDSAMSDLVKTIAADVENSSEKAA
ncbi:hypothetical protein ACIA8K_11650 [Catenuloplanes sp. NPDC051500]|uniref:TRADD-N-associated membrane domain-containing protein n=1 Tax=Catenuloplanes sp. NPDC051500 TaxID=3363959 RepID=UPI0037B638E8